MKPAPAMSYTTGAVKSFSLEEFREQVEQLKGAAAFSTARAQLGLIDELGFLAAQFRKQSGVLAPTYETSAFLHRSAARLDELGARMTAILNGAGDVA